MDSGIVEGDRTAAQRHGEMPHSHVETGATRSEATDRAAVADAAGRRRLDLERAKLAVAAARIAASATLHADDSTSNGKRNTVALCRGGDLTIGHVARRRRRDEGAKQSDCDEQLTHLDSP